MRIGVDARELCGHATGAGRYLSGLIREWSAAPANPCELVLYAPESLAHLTAAAHVTSRIVPGAPGTWWEQVRLPAASRGDQLDVFFSPAYSAPIRLDVPSVVAIHDVSFMTHPEWFRTREGVRRRWLTRRSARQASAVVTISKFSRDEIVRAIGLPESRVHVIPPGVTAPTRNGLADEGDERVLFVGSIFNRRHVPDLIRSFGAVARRRPRASLDVVGDNRTHPHENLIRTIESEGLQARVRWHQYASEAKLADLYSRARAFAFLSEYEGLGLTPLEALAADVPPVLLDTPVARESCGDAALYVRQGDIAGTARALEQALADRAIRSRLLAAAPAVLARYRWPRAAGETMALLRDVVNSRQSIVDRRPSTD
jgi:glycosyltransferase involved in cell wall biosynthesis